MRSHHLEGVVRHRRARPFVYALEHAVHYIAFDLDELDDVVRSSRLIGRNRRSVLELRDSDHMIPPARDLRTAFLDQYRIKRDGTPFMRLSGLAVAPNGDIYVADGYASDSVHRFDKAGKYLNTFGGKQEPYKFSTLHKLAIDTRFSPLRIIATDRANNRMVHLSMDGGFLGVIADSMMLPAAVAIWGDYAAVAELGGQITVLDKEGRRAAVLGTNTQTDEKGNRTVAPSKWRPGIVTAPHGIAVNVQGDIFVSELNTFGRLHRFNRQ